MCLAGREAARLLLSMPEPHAMVMYGNNPSLLCKQQNVLLQGPWASGGCEEAKQLVPVTDQAWFVGWLYSVLGMLHPTTASALTHRERGSSLGIPDLEIRESGRSQAAVRRRSAVCN